MDRVSFEFSPMPDDFAAATRDLAATNKILWLLSGWFGFPLIALFIFLLFRGEINAENFGRAVLGLVIGFVALMYPFSIPASARRAALRNKKFSLSQKYVFDTEQVIVSTNDYETKHKWDVYQKFSESKGFYFLIYAANPGGFLFVPKRIFQAKEEEMRFRSLISRHFSSIQAIDKGLVGWKLAALASLVATIVNFLAFSTVL